MVKNVIDMNDKSDNNGIVTNPKISICFVVHEIPKVHGAMLSGITP